MYFLEVEEYTVSNGKVWRLEERLVVVRRWEAQEREKVWIDQILSKDVGPTCKHVAALIGNVLKQVRSISFAD